MSEAKKLFRTRLKQISADLDRLDYINKELQDKIFKINDPSIIGNLIFWFQNKKLDNLFHKIGKLRQESVDIKREMEINKSIVLLVNLAKIDPEIWELFEFINTKSMTESDLDNELFDNLF